MSKEQKVGFSFHDVFPDKELTCNRRDEVFQYFENLLSEKNAETFEQHLKDCSVCSQLLADLNETNRAAEATIIDAGRAEKIFEQTRGALEQRLKTGVAASEKARIHIPPPKSFSIPAYVNILLIGLVAALMYPSYKSFVLDNQVAELKKELDAEKSKNVIPPQDIQTLKENYEKQIQNLNEERSKLLQPDLSGSAVYSVRTERSGTTQTINVLFGENQKTFSLVFSAPVGEFKNYLVEIYDDGKPIWQDEIALTTQPDSTSALISVNLKAEYLKQGIYRLRISGVKKNRSVQLNEFKLKVSNE